MVYQYKVERKRAVNLTPQPSDLPLPSLKGGGEEELEFIQGIWPDSIEEVRVARSLKKYGLEFIYHYPIYGGTGLAGGQEVDFVVMAPWQDPLQVMGEYWHPGEADPYEALKLEMIRQYFGREARILWARQLKSQAETDRKIRELYR